MNTPTTFFLGVAVLVAALAGTTLIEVRRRRRRLDRSLRRLGHSLSGSWEMTSVDNEPVLAGVHSGLRVMIGGFEVPVRNHPSVAGLRLLVCGSGETGGRMPVGDFDKEMNAAALKLGDAWLDRTARFAGDRALVAAAMNAARRKALERLIVATKAMAAPADFETEAAVQDRPAVLFERSPSGTLVYVEVLTTQPHPVIPVIHDVVEMVRDIDADPTPTAEALLMNVRQDPCPAVRLKCFKNLCRAYAEDQRFPTALELALQDADLNVRYFALGQTSRERARPQLEALVRDPTVDLKIREHALRDCLDSPDGVRAARALLDDALRALPVREMAQEYLVRQADQPLIAEMCERIDSEDDAWCLGLLGVLRERDLPANLEARLIGLLERRTPDLRVSAAFLLAKVGTVQAVDPLLAQLGQPDYDEMARFAIRQIRMRLGPVEAGRLSIASPAGPAGGLSLAPEPGALSKADDCDDSEVT